MPLPLALTPTQRGYYEAALRSDKRNVRFVSSFWDKDGNALRIDPILLDGEVVVDASDPDEQVTRTASATFVDPDRSLFNHVSHGGAWFNKQVGFTVRVWVSQMANWVEVPLFRGWVFEVTRRGIETNIIAQGKDAQHLGDYMFHRPKTLPKGERKDKAIRNILETRGESDFALEKIKDHLNKRKSYPVGASPWKACQKIADSANKQLFVDGRGTFRLRDVPEQPCWKFSIGNDSTLVGYPEEIASRDGLIQKVIVKGSRRIFREEKSKTTSLSVASAATDTTITVASTNGFAVGRKVDIGGGGNNDPEARKITAVNTSTKVVTLGRALNNAHRKGATVVVYIQEEKRSRLPIGRASLDRQHPLSAQALTNGDRPTVKLVDRPQIHRQKGADDKAARIMKRQRKGLTAELHFESVPIWHLEELDRVAVQVNKSDTRIVPLTQFSLPLHPDGTMEVGWGGKRVPRRRHR